MNRDRYAAWLFFAAAVFVAGCDGHSGSGGGSAALPQPPAPGPAAPAADTELAAFVRAGLTDAENVEPRLVNDVTFVTSEQEAELNDWF
jgi:hypothetical protein